MTTPNHPPLSPAAQTVINAAGRRYGINGSLQDSIAAALRAAADRLECAMPEDSAYAAGYYEALEEISGIAAELEGHA